MDDRVTDTEVDMAAADRPVVDPEALRVSVREKYREVAARPAGDFHFHTGRPLAARLGYDTELVDGLPDRAVESFAGVADPLTLRPLAPGEHVVDLGSGAGFDCFCRGGVVGAAGRVVGVDMTPEMVHKARATAQQLGVGNVEFREGLIEDVPVDDGWADVVMSNGVLNLVVDKPRAMREIFRALRPGGALAFADIAVGRVVPDEVACNIDLWTDCIAGGQSLDAWRRLMQHAGFVDVDAGPAVDTFGGARGEGNAVAFEVMAHAFLGRKPAGTGGRQGEEQAMGYRLQGKMLEAGPVRTEIEAIVRCDRPADGAVGHRVLVDPRLRRPTWRGRPRTTADVPALGISLDISDRNAVQGDFLDLPPADATDAGFGRVDVLPIDHEFWRFYRLVP